MTTYLRFTSDGGRIGRIKWENTTEDTWGDTAWDHWWPALPPQARTIEEISANLARLCASMAGSFQAISPKIAAAEKAIRELGEAMRRAG